MPSFYEFFAGGGLARAGLGPNWTCLFANDIDPKKAATYRQNWGHEEITVKDIGRLTTNEVPGTADLAWASFPCQDLSLAGMGAGLKGFRSGTFWLFWRLMKALISEHRKPGAIVLENVCGALTSNDGKDFISLCQALREGGYRCGALVIDTALFLPQSRPRLFVIGVRNETVIDSALVSNAPQHPFHNAALRTAYELLPPAARADWIWWRLAVPALRKQRFADIIEETPSGVPWHTPQETQKLLSLMSPHNLIKMENAKRMGQRMVGALYKRTRPNDLGIRVQRAEIRFDDIAGCLRTPNGGSSRQTIVIVHRDKVKSRLISPRETARLMGLPDTYVLPAKYNDAYHLTGDGVAVPVVRHLAQHIIEPLTRSVHLQANAAA